MMRNRCPNGWSHPETLTPPPKKKKRKLPQLLIFDPPPPKKKKSTQFTHPFLWLSPINPLSQPAIPTRDLGNRANSRNEPICLKNDKTKSTEAPPQWGPIPDRIASLRAKKGADNKVGRRVGREDRSLHVYMPTFIVNMCRVLSMRSRVLHISVFFFVCE